MSKELYLGRDSASLERILYDSDTLVTHGVILGMTGSGKTGLALGLLEETARSGIPIIAIDPKGDLPNLALLFPEFSPDQFQDWTDPAEAQREGLSLSDLAARKAKRWKEGLAEWGLGSKEVENLKNRLDLRIWTPGSRAVRPVNLLGTFQSPGRDIPAEELGESASGTVSALLSLVADGVDPLRDPRHLLLVQILTSAWSNGQDLTLEELIGRLLDPPFAKVGVFPVDTFFSPDERMKLAMQLNNLLASPTFAPWKEGQSLEIQTLMESSHGKTPVNIFTLAHLGEKERQFFVSRLMNEILTWSRGLPGSSSLRALIYFDEVAGYLPPHPHNPPSKNPILTMLKQSRAVGVGLCLATQNPVDIDYKALSNMGTWMIGRLQTEQDRNRVRDGLMSASGGLTAQEVEKEFSKIKPRTFLLKKPKDDKPILFETRWAMSYLRGPVTLSELSRLPQASSSSPPPSTEPAASSAVTEASAKPTPPPVPSGFGQSFFDPRYVFHSRLNGYFESAAEPTRADGKILHRPALRAVLKLQFDERQDNFILHQRHHFVAFPIDRSGSIAQRFESLALEEDDLLKSPENNSVFIELPDDFDEAHELKSAQDSLTDHLYRTLTSTRFSNSKVKLYSKPGETREEFVARCSVATEDLADQAAAKLRQSLETKIKRVADRIDKGKGKVDQLALTEKGKKVEGLWKAGEMLLGLFTKKRKSFSTVLGSSRRALEADSRTKRAEGEVEKLEAELLELQEELETKLDELEAKYAAYAEQVEERELRLNRNDITVERFEILWIPVTRRI